MRPIGEKRNDFMKSGPVMDRSEKQAKTGERGEHQFDGSRL